MLEGYHHLIDLIGQLPSDFKRVEEEMRALRDTILADLRDDERPLGQTIDDYLARSDWLLDTAEGRALEGALKLLRDQAMLAQLSNDLDVVLAHQFTEVLTTDEVRAFRGTVSMVQSGINDVLGQRQRASQALAERIRHHDAVRERELAATLRSLRAALSKWYPSSKVHARVPVALLPDRVETLAHVRERFYDPGEHTPAAHTIILAVIRPIGSDRSRAFAPVLTVRTVSSSSAQLNELDEPLKLAAEAVEAHKVPGHETGGVSGGEALKGRFVPWPRLPTRCGDVIV